MAAALEAGGIVGDATPHIRQAIWSKLVLNLGVGPLAILSQSYGAELLVDPACREALRQISTEVAAIAAAMGCPIAIDTDRQIASARGLGHMPSILQDLQLGRSMEVDAMLTLPRELARLAEVPTPTLDLLVALTRLRAAAAGLYAIV